MSCVNELVSINGLCGDVAIVGKSGYDLMKAPEISLQRSAATANEKHITGMNLLRSCKALGEQEVTSDFLAVLDGNGFSTGLDVEKYDTGKFNVSKPIPVTVLQRGAIIHKASAGKGLTSIRVSKVKVYPLVSQVSVPFKFEDDAIYTYLFDLEAGKVNEFTVDFTAKGSSLKVTAANVSLAGSQITCMVGCNGVAPNPCGWAKGFNGSTEITTESFGIVLEFSCVCDYELIMCAMGKSYIGKLIWLRSRLIAIDEQLSSNRLNNIVIYSSERLATETRPAIQAEYDRVWNDMLRGLPNVLQRYQGACVECKDTKIYTNI